MCVSYLPKQGFVYRHSKHDLTSLHDPDGKEQARELLEALKKGHSQTMDETILSLHLPLRVCWMKRGQQKCIPTPGIQQRMHLFGAYCFEEDTLVWKAARHKNSQAFIEFLEHLFVERYPTGHSMTYFNSIYKFHDYATVVPFRAPMTVILFITWGYGVVVYRSLSASIWNR